MEALKKIKCVAEIKIGLEKCSIPPLVPVLDHVHGDGHGPPGEARHATRD